MVPLDAKLVDVEGAWGDQSANSAIDGDGSTNTGGTPSSSESGNNSNDQSGRGQQQLARRETENVNRLRLLVLTILCTAAVGVSVLIYFVSRNAEDDDMTSQFHAASNSITKSFNAIRTERIATLASLAVAAIAHGVDHSRDWPFVSLSSFQQRAFIAKANSGALQVSIAPLVMQEDRLLWEEYVVSDEADTDWIERSIIYQNAVGVDRFILSYGDSFRGDVNVNGSHIIKTSISNLNGNKPLEAGISTAYLPLWETSPFLSFEHVNVDLLQAGEARGYYGNLSISEGGIVLGGMDVQAAGGIESPNLATSTYSQLLSAYAEKETEYLGGPMTNVFIPIFDSFADDRAPVAVLIGLFHWAHLFQGVLPDTTKGIDVVLRNTCFEPFTFRIMGQHAIPLGPGDLHEMAFDSWEVTTPILEKGRTADGTKAGLEFVERDCYYTASVYPSQSFAQAFVTSTPWILVAAVAGVLVFAIIMFFVYDRLVERRQTLVLRKAVQSTAIVSSLFPKTVRDRLMRDAINENGTESHTVSAFRDKMRNKKGNKGSPSTLGGTNNPGSIDDDGQVIADLFPNCTVLFADIAGFTAWSSAREPSEVFVLLQTLYGAFDKVALRRRVFKVETIGDSYVAVTGLPEPQVDHAVLMCKFARDCMHQMHQVMQALEIRLGPDTTDLSMRFGLNSGQVTGGVLRGDRARFQLFGDTVNTAARMESSGQRGRIHLSSSTASLLKSAGKERWITPREDLVTVKGKGTLKTWWLETGEGGPTTPTALEVQLNQSDNSNCTTDTVPAPASSLRILPKSMGPSTVGMEKKQVRLIGWMSEVLCDYVKQIVAKNKAEGRVGTTKAAVVYGPAKDAICLDELVETFAFPTGSTTSATMGQYRTVVLPPKVTDQVRRYVAVIASRYNSSNPFHNFDHACHVTMSVHKLMKRVVSDGGAEDSDDLEHPKNGSNATTTYGILTSDPLTLFAIVFSGLIHDVDHQGVSNMQLATEDLGLAQRYRHKCIAEQNSLDIAWELLMSDTFAALRQAIFPTQSDLLRFRQVVVNIVLATDIFDKDLSSMRTERWNNVFATTKQENDDHNHTRATIVLEHIMQASDVSHTMQHWHVYVRWNRRLFEEMHLAYRQGRMGKDPAEFWYQGELGFFDNYVIPLAKKLQECRVFGVSSDEYLNYALSNRTEWQLKGEAMIAEMKQSIVGET